MRLLFGEDPEFIASIKSEKGRLNILWFVDNIDEVFLEFLGTGIEIVSPLKDYSYELREFAFIDINGYYFRVAEGVDNQ